MLQLNSLAIVVAAVAAFVVSSVWYTIFGKTVAVARGEAASDTGRMPVWKLLVELVRSLVVATVLAGLCVKLGASSVAAAMLLGFVLWVGFPLVLWTGAIIWENVPVKLAAIHAGDWLAKLVLVAAIVGVWR